MRRRHVIVGAVVLALVAVLAVAFCPGRRRPCRATFEQVREGMTREEVRATVGARPSNEGIWVRTLEMHPSEHWLAADAHLAVAFGDDGRAIFVQVSDATDPPSRWTRLRARLGL
jgi:hypothetical protein